MKCNELAFNERALSLEIKVRDGEVAEIIPATVTASFELDKRGRLISITLYLPEDDAELKSILKENFKKAIKIPIPARR